MIRVDAPSMGRVLVGVSNTTQKGVGVLRQNIDRYVGVRTGAVGLPNLLELVQGIEPKRCLCAQAMYPT